MATTSDEFFDFFDIRNDGELPRATRIQSADGTFSTVQFKAGFVENFDFGWNVETTYGIYRERIETLLSLAEQQEQHSTAAQALLASALVLAVSGLETLVWTAAKLKEAPRQSIDEFVRIVEKVDGYKPIEPRDRAPLGRMFEARHAIVHYGWRMTTALQGRIDSRAPVQRQLLFNVERVRKVIEAADRFAASLGGCFKSLELGEESQ